MALGDDDAMRSHAKKKMTMTHDIDRLGIGGLMTMTGQKAWAGAQGRTA